MHEPKNRLYRESRKFHYSLAESFTNFTQSHFFTHKNFFCTCLSSLSAKFSHFYKPKAFLLHKSFLNCHPKQLFSTLRLPFAPPLTYCPQKIPIFTSQKLSFAQTFPYSHPKQPFSTLRSPFQPPLTYCPQKIPIFTSQKLSFAQTFPYSHPKQPFSTLRSPFQPPLTYCLQRMQLFF